MLIGRNARHLAEDFPLRVITPSPHLQPYTYERSEAHGVSLLQLGHTGSPKTFLQSLADVLEAESRDTVNPLFLAFYCNEMAYAVALAAARCNSAPLAVRPRQRRRLGSLRRVRFPHPPRPGPRPAGVLREPEMAAKVRAFWPGAKARYVPNGVATHRFTFQEGYTPNTRPVVGLFGDVKQKKGLELLLTAPDFQRFDLRIVGQLREGNRKLLHGFLTLHPDAGNGYCHGVNLRPDSGSRRVPM